MRLRMLLVGILGLFFVLLFSQNSYAKGSYKYEYNNNNILTKIFKDENTYMKFIYDKNGNLTEKVVLLPPPKNINSEVIANNHVKITWDPVPGAVSYHIYQKTDDETIDIEVANIENTFIELNKLNTNTLYSLFISSKGENGHTGDKSNVITITLDSGDNIESPVNGILKKDSNPISSIPFSIHTLDGSKWYDTTSNSTGAFEFLLPDGQYILDGVWIEAEWKWYELNQRLTVFNGKLIGGNLLDINLKMTTNNVTGSLKKGTDPFPNITFSIRNSTGETKWYDTQTNESGNFALYLPDGSYILEGIWASAENHWYEIQKEFVVEGTLILDINVLDQSEKNFSGTLKKGEAILPNTVFSIRTANGEVNWYDLQTDLSGHFSAKIPDGIYILEGVWIESEGHWYELQKDITIEGNLQLIIDVTEG